MEPDYALRRQLYAPGRCLGTNLIVYACSAAAALDGRLLRSQPRVVLAPATVGSKDRLSHVRKRLAVHLLADERGPAADPAVSVHARAVAPGDSRGRVQS